MSRLTIWNAEDELDDDLSLAIGNYGSAVQYEDGKHDGGFLQLMNLSAL